MGKRIALAISILALGTLVVVPVGAVQVQVGAFSDADNADDRARELREEGHSVKIQSTASGLNRVRIVNVSDTEKPSLLSNLRQRGIDYYVIGKEPEPVEQYDDSKNLPDSIPPMRFGHQVKLSDRIRNRLDRAMGAEYVWGGESFEEGGFDCSGLLVWLFRFDDMPRTSRYQWKWTNRVKQSNLRPGDFVFFNFESTDEPDHVGLYLGDDRFVHASSTYGVIKADFTKQYYQKSFFGAGRPPRN